MANILNSAPSPVSSSPLRRKSVTLQRIQPPLSENDDEAERLARRSEIFDNTTNATSSRDQRRSSLGLSSLGQMSSSQMAERIAQCIKLNAENKINSKNAFRLEMIDFMTYMIKKKDANMTNLQVASTSLDVSTKIYGFRVDGIHMDILKLVGGLDKQEKDAEKQKDLEEMDCEDSIRDNKNRDKSKLEKRKRKTKKQIFTTVEALKTNIETEKPSLITMESDSQTTDTLYQVMLPNHANSGFYQHPYNDVLVDTVNRNDTPDKRTVCDVPRIKGLSKMEICPPLFYFDFHTKNVDDDESDETLSEGTRNNEDRFQFNLDASVQHGDEYVSTDMNHYDDLELTDEENGNRCAMTPDQIENIVDFRQVVTSTVPSQLSEYSFVNKNTNLHWAGPSHWKFNNLRTVSSVKSAKSQQHRNLQAGRKEKVELTISYDNIDIEVMNDKFLPSKKIKLNTKTLRSAWNEEILTLPSDEHYNIINVNKLYLYPKTIEEPENGNNLNTTSLSDTPDDDNMHNVNDGGSDLFPNVQNEEYLENNASEDRYKDVEYQQTQAYTPLIGDNLVAIPKHTKKVAITYSACAKKVDMKQLKQSIWSCLESENNNNNISEEQAQQDSTSDGKSYRDVYKKLPTLLSKTNKEALSFPLSFVSLLHLANEKNLELNSSPDMADIIIHQN
ncbi:condensin complex subunit 2 [Ceratina calcarata]|uniref:Condensin complex subunit 2 n=1 Tax=Ceratina calcarata TaxID=156304 RepID=A0AAJ7NCZ6_9HYME|nr:condensin complex subunit 2 [Ceratina calcarata]